MSLELSFKRKLSKLKPVEPVRVYGRITKIVGLTVESEGPPSSVGEVLKLEDHRIKTPLQVIEFNSNKVISMPFGEIKGISNGHLIYSTGQYPGLNVDESFLGRVINGLGQPLDDKGPLKGRELKDFIINSLGDEGLNRAVVVAATSDEPPLLKIISAFAAAAIAEYFCKKGQDVMLMMGSMTRLSMAQREVGLSAGEPPSTKGYTPSVFTMMPKLVERAGNFSGQGSITAIYTVLVEGDDITEPISDHARSLLDGHILLSRDIADRNHYPAVDILGSVSRLMTDISSQEHKDAAGKLRELLAVYRDAEDLINIGAYAKGSNPKIDEAIQRVASINNFLKQGIKEKITLEQTLEQLKAAVT